MPLSESVKLNTGAHIPIIGLGTWRSAPGAVEHAVEYALKNGYKHIDTATAYDNETEVGEGIKASGVPREHIFLTTKLHNIDHKDPLEALQLSLSKLGTSYLDLWLMHWPAPMTKDFKADKSHDWIDTWKSMEKLYKEHPDKIKAIGVSNVSVEFFERLLKEATVVPAVNQIESHPACPQQDIVDFCTKHGVVITAYSPLGSEGSPLLKNEVVTKLATKYKVHPSNILISLQANKPNVNVIPKSVTNERILSNLTLVELTNEEIVELNSIEKTQPYRVCGPEWTGWGSLGFPKK